MADTMVLRVRDTQRVVYWCVYQTDAGQYFFTGGSHSYRERLNPTEREWRIFWRGGLEEPYRNLDSFEEAFILWASLNQGQSDG